MLVEIFPGEETHLKYVSIEDSKNWKDQCGLDFVIVQMPDEGN